MGICHEKVTHILTTVKATQVKTRILVHKLAISNKVTRNTQAAASAKLRYNSSFNT